MSDVNDVTGSSPVENNVENKSTQDVTTDSSSENKTSEYVPYDRFKEVVEQKNELSQRIESLEERFSPKQPEPQDETPDPFDDPKAYAEWVQDKAYERIKQEQQDLTQAETEKEKLIEQQFAEIRKHNEGVEIDEEKIGEFAIENNIFNSDPSKGYDLVKAYNLYKKINTGPSSSKLRSKVAPITTKGSTNETGINIGRKDLKNMSLENLVDTLSRN